MIDLVLVHGMFGSATAWQLLVPPLEAAGYRVHAPDLPGHGQDAARGLRGLGINDYTRAVRELVDSLAAPPVLLGHSMGALVAQRVAAEVPAAGLALLAPVPPRCLMRLDFRRLAICWFLLKTYGPRFRPYRLSRKQADHWLFDGWPADLAEQAWQGMGEESARVLFEMECWPLDWRGSNRVDRKRIRCPVFVAEAGRERMLAPGMAEKIAAHYQAEYHRYDGAGHLLILEPAAERLAADLLAWLASL